jgi:hypothetical protein
MLEKMQAKNYPGKKKFLEGGKEGEREEKPDEVSGFSTI